MASFTVVSKTKLGFYRYSWLVHCLSATQPLDISLHNHQYQDLHYLLFASAVLLVEVKETIKGSGLMSHSMPEAWNYLESDYTFIDGMIYRGCM